MLTRLSSSSSSFCSAERWRRSFSRTHASSWSSLDSSLDSSDDSKRSRICVGVGGNLGDRLQNFAKTLDLLSQNGFDLVKAASLYETKPEDVEDQPRFLNSAVVLTHSNRWTIRECLRKLKDIEREMGRDVENTTKGPRPVDLDVLFSEKTPLFRGKSGVGRSEKRSLSIASNDDLDVEVPHPRIKERPFVLAPIADLSPKEEFDKNGDVSITFVNQMIAATKIWRTRFCGEETLMGTDVIQRVAPFKRNFPLEPYEGESKVMGVLNVTPDSFSDGGMFNSSVETALRRAEQLASQGARIIDVGGQSTRPGASKISASEEISRILPILKVIVERFKNDPRNIAVSVDTFYGEVVRVADEIGVDIINDVSGGDWDDDMLSAVSNTSAPLAYIVSHQRENPEIMGKNAFYDTGCVAKTVGDEIASQFHRKISPARIVPWRCWIDPGFGFAKSSEHCEELLSNLKDIRKSLHANGCAGLAKAPMLVGMSRKRFIGNMLAKTKGSVDTISFEERDNASAAATVVALMSGANVVRAHEVRKHVEAARVTDVLKK